LFVVQFVITRFVVRRRVMERIAAGEDRALVIAG
jgi:hypothetical protein